MGDTKTMPEPMPEWPDAPGDMASPEDEYLYMKRNYQTAMAKLRVAVEALRQLDGMVHSISQEAVSEALATIGPLPEDTSA